MDPFPDPSSLSFATNNITSIRHWDSMFKELDLPQKPLNTYHYAVDGNMTTCWNSFVCKYIHISDCMMTWHSDHSTLLDPRKGDYFGLNMVGSIRAKRLFIYTHTSVRNPASVFRIHTSEKKGEWVIFPNESSQNHVPVALISNTKGPMSL